MIVAWQGWRIEVPDRWAPVKIEGDAQAGHLLMADLHRPRLGIRWRMQTSRRFDAPAAIARTMKEEVGELESGEARGHDLCGWVSPLLYEDREPPGRDLWVGYSPRSSRLFQVVYHAHRRDRALAQKLLPTLADGPLDGALDWSVFELSCRTPAGLRLAKHRLNAGDLSLLFEGKQRQAAIVRQIAPAKLALSRWPMQRWIADVAAWHGREFKVVGAPEAMADASRSKVVRRRRFSWMFWLARGYVVLARHEEARNRLVLVNATDEELARTVLESVGWARIDRQ